MKEDCLFGLEHLGYALAGDGDENEMFLLHDNTMFKNLTTTLTTSSAGEQHTPAAWGSLWTRFYNNAAKIFGAEGVLRRRLGNREVMVRHKESGRPCESKSSTNVFLLKKFFFARRLRRRLQNFKHCLYCWYCCF